MVSHDSHVESWLIECTGRNTILRNWANIIREIPRVTSYELGVLDQLIVLRNEFACKVGT